MSSVSLIKAGSLNSYSSSKSTSLRKASVSQSSGRQNSELGLPLGRVDPRLVAIKWQFQWFLNLSHSPFSNLMKQNSKHSWTMETEPSIKPRLESSAKNCLHHIGLCFASWDQRLSIRWFAGDVAFKKLLIPANSSSRVDLRKIWIGSVMLFSVSSSDWILVGTSPIPLMQNSNSWEYQMDFCYLVLPLTRLFTEKTHQYTHALKNLRVSIYHIRQYVIKSLVPRLNNSASSTFFPSWQKTLSILFLDDIHNGCLSCSHTFAFKNLSYFPIP